MKYLLPLLFPAILCAVEVELSWSDNSQNESGFEIERRAPDGEFEAIATVLADVAEYTDDTAAGTYEYRVRAFNEFGYSGYTNTLKASAGETPTDPGDRKAIVSKQIPAAIVRFIVLTHTCGVGRCVERKEIVAKNRAPAAIQGRRCWCGPRRARRCAGCNSLQ